MAMGRTFGERYGDFVFRQLLFSYVRFPAYIRHFAEESRYMAPTTFHAIGFPYHIPFDFFLSFHDWPKFLLILKVLRKLPRARFVHRALHTVARAHQLIISLSLSTPPAPPTGLPLIIKAIDLLALPRSFHFILFFLYFRLFSRYDICQIETCVIPLSNSKSRLSHRT